MRTEPHIAASRANGAKSRHHHRPSYIRPGSTAHGLATAGRWKLPSSIWKSQSNAKTRNSRPRTTSSQHASAAQDFGHNLRLMDRYETRMRRSYERAIENLYQFRDRRKNRKFPNEPKNSGE